MRFQFTLPRGERQRVVESPLRFTIRFNSRSREGSDVVQADTLKEAVAFQFTLPRGERPGRFAFLASANVVSIHAPARGATFVYVRSRKEHVSFNSRSREGSDVATSRTSFVISGFNSRSREGSDAKFLIATVNTCGFNSRSREGSDKERDGQLMELVQFQFTLPRGERLPISASQSDRRTGFNSRSREGSDHKSA